MCYFPVVLHVISKLKCILHQNFGQLNLPMLISSIILFIIDLREDIHVRECMRASVKFLFQKTSPQKLLTGFFTKFHRNVP